MIFLRAAELRRERVASFEAYPFSLPVIRQLRRLEFCASVTVFVGENGIGKSTLLEALALAAGLNPEGGSRNFAFGTRASHSELHGYLRLVRAPAPTAGRLLPAGRIVLQRRHPHRRARQDPSSGSADYRLVWGRVLARAVPWRVVPHPLAAALWGFRSILLDEPEAALSPTRQLAALARMHQLVEAGSQFIMATHSPILMAYPGAQLLGLSEAGIGPLKYDETEHVIVMRQFMNNRTGLLAELLREDTG